MFKFEQEFDQNETQFPKPQPLVKTESCQPNNLKDEIESIKKE